MNNNIKYLKAVWKKLVTYCRKGKYLEAHGWVRTPEGVMFQGDSIEDYEKGALVFSFLAKQPVGTMAVAKYRKLKVQPYKEPSVYLLQFTNFFKMMLLSLGIFCVGVPATMFWLATIGLLSGQMQPNDLSIFDVGAVFFMVSSAFISLIIVTVGIASKGRRLGLKNMFARRFETLLESKITGLKDLRGYTIGWQAQPVKEAESSI